VRGDAVIAREYQDFDVLEPGRFLSLPMGEPCDEPLETPEAAGGLCELRVALAYRLRDCRMAFRQVEACCVSLYIREQT
jgi:hypothetical protein